MKDSGLIVFEKKGNSTLPSYQNLEGSMMESEMKLNRIAHSFIKEEENEEIWRLKTDLFEKKNAVTRQCCKTDRL